MTAQLRTCPVCGGVVEGRANKMYCSQKCKRKVLSSRSRHKHGDAKKERDRAYYQKNLEKCREKSRVYHKANPEKNRERNRAYRKRKSEKYRACIRKCKARRSRERAEESFLYTMTQLQESINDSDRTTQP